MSLSAREGGVFFVGFDDLLDERVAESFELPDGQKEDRLVYSRKLTEE